MPMFPVKVCVFFTLALLSCTATLAQDVTSSVLVQDTQARDAAAVAASVIPPQIAVGDVRSLSGEYSFGNGLDENCTLEISPDGRFFYKRCNCEVVVEQVAGIVAMQDGELRLQPDKPRDKWPRGAAPNLVPVTWGQRLYLVPQDDLVGFSNHVNKGLEPVTRGNMGRYFLREGDWDRPATGKPELPPDWKKRLLDKPITGQVAGKDPGGRWIINLGQNHGVYDHMELSAWTTDQRQFVALRVTETGSETSAVAIEGAPADTPILGWIVYSRIAPPAKDQPVQK